MTSDRYQILVGQALRFVSLRPRSVSELRIYLEKQAGKIEASEVEINQVLVRLSELGYADDRKFAFWLAESRTRSHTPKGERMIIEELRQKGISPAISEEVTQSLFHGNQAIGIPLQYDAAMKTARKKVQLLKKYPQLVRKKKLWDYLARRGFTNDIISSVIDDMLQKEYNISMEEGEG